MMNLFEQAILKGELLDFAVGNGEYYIPDRSFGEHSAIQSWTNFILPLIKLKGEIYVSNAIKNMFEIIVKNNSIDSKVKNETILFNLNVYYYLLKESRINPISFNGLNSTLLESLNNYINSLNDELIRESFLECIDLIKSRGGLS